MPSTSGKLTPAEFLAELKRTRQTVRDTPPPAASVASPPVATVAPPTRPAARVSLASQRTFDVLDLDFSDLDEPAPKPTAPNATSRVAPPTAPAENQRPAAPSRTAPPRVEPQADEPPAPLAPPEADDAENRPLARLVPEAPLSQAPGPASPAPPSDEKDPETRPAECTAPSAEPSSEIGNSDVESEESAAAVEQSALAAPEAPADDVPAGETALAADARSDAAPIRTNTHLNALFERVNQLLGGASSESGPFRPRTPASLDEARLSSEEVERLILKYLLSKGSGSGRVLAGQVKLPFNIVDPILKQLKQEQLLAYKGAAEVGDYDYAITDFGRERARRYNDECSYFGAAPVSLHDYLEAMAAQSIAKQEVTEDDLKRAFSDLIINKDLLEILGPAINSGRGMFLFGEPGNGKTSIAERITKCFGSTIWIPRALGIDGDIIRVYDPGIHDLIEEQPAEKGLFDLSGVDQRWVQIVRPTVIAGGELTMKELEVTQNLQTKICEAPLQLKSNCGTLVIDDFGRQTMPVDVLLNRWIVPLEKRYDFLNLPSGKKVQVPFDQLIIFSTNLEPKDLVDGAFLRRIPYKIQAPDPSEDEFHKLFQLMAPKLGFPYERSAVEHLIETHYRNKRPFRACQPRDLLLQVKNYCVYRGLPRKLTPEAFDFAVKNYFSVL